MNKIMNQSVIQKKKKRLTNDTNKKLQKIYHIK